MVWVCVAGCLLVFGYAQKLCVHACHLGVPTGPIRIKHSAFDGDILAQAVFRHAFVGLGLQTMSQSRRCPSPPASAHRPLVTNLFGGFMTRHETTLES